MSAPSVDFWLIYAALTRFERSAENRMYSARGGDADSAREDWREAQRARAEFRKLQAVWPRAKTLIEEADRAYDRRVLTQGQSGPEEGCSCHINPPCGYCTREPDEEEDDAATE